MSEIRSMIVTAKIGENNRSKLESMVGKDKIKYFEPFSFPEMMEMASAGKSREEIMRAHKEHRDLIREYVKSRNPDVAILGHDIDDTILSGHGMKWIHCTHAGLEKSSSAEVLGRGIVLTSSAGRNSAGLAEHAMFFILALAFDSNLIRDVQKSRKFSLGPKYKARTAIFGKTVGIIGCGHNGTELAKRLMPFGVRVLGYDRFSRVDDSFTEILDAKPENLMRIASECDFLVLTISLNDSTFHIVDEKLLSLMKPTSYLINIARGGLVDEKALVSALQSHRIAGAGLDTFESEPLPEDSPLWDMPEVICTPHTTPSVIDMEDKQWGYVFENVKAFQTGGRFVNRIAEEDIYTKENIK